MYAHPFDATLQQLGWTRQTFDALPSRQDLKVAVSLLVITPPDSSQNRHTAAIVDLRLWQQNRKARIELVSQTIPTALEPIVINGLTGVRPAALGLRPCQCTGNTRRWQSHMLPLVPHQTMTRERLQPVISRYIELVRVPNWACQVPTHLMP